MTKKIVLTGGGTAGHVTPNIALIGILKANNWQIDYIGSKDGVERKMIEGLDVPYHFVKCGKLRRYFSWQNFIDPINLFIGIIQAYFLLRKLKTEVIFSKGGFVSLPVVIGGYLNKIPVIIHESDISPGLANKLSFPFAKTICTNFAETRNHIKNKNKVAVVGTPIRHELFHGNKERGLNICSFSSDKPCLLVMGGGQGSSAINKVIRDSLSDLVEKYQIIHLCGNGNLAKELLDVAGYYQFEYASSEMGDLFAASDLVISRSGANSLCEIIALKKPHILVPLSSRVSRGDQIQNAKYFANQGISIVLDEDELSKDKLLESIKKCEDISSFAVDKMTSLGVSSAGKTIFDLLNVI